MLKHQHDGVRPDRHARSRKRPAEAERRDFMTSLGHSFRTSLHNIYGSAQLLDAGMRRALPRAQRHNVHRIEANERHLLRLVDSVISVARWDEVDDSRHNVIAADIVVRAESTRLREIIVQLMLTAVKFWRPRDSMFVHALAVGDRVWIRVSGTAVGIAERDLAQSLQRLTPQKKFPLRDGAGSGFAVTQRLARAMGGQLTVVSKPGRAPTFTLALQRRRAPQAVETETPIPVATEHVRDPQKQAESPGEAARADDDGMRFDEESGKREGGRA